MKIGMKRKYLFVLLSVLLLLLAGSITAYAKEESQEEGIQENVKDEATDEITDEPPVLSAPENLTAEKTGYRQVTLHWDPVDGAVVYKVFLVDHDSYIEKAVVEGTQNTCVLEEVPLSEDAYTYTVRAYAEGDDEIYTEASEPVKISMMLDAPVLTSAKLTTSNRIKVTWKAVDHAEGYYVYRKTPDSSWKRQTIKPIQNLSYTDSKTSPGETYIYTVRAVGMNGDEIVRSEYDKNGISEKTLKSSKVTSVSVVTCRSVKINWTKVSGADGYYVYQQYKGKWKKIATVKGKTTYTYGITSPNKVHKYWGKKFAYKVVPYAGKATGSYSNRVLITMKPPAAALTKASSVSYNTNRVYWKKTTASGYKIYRRTKAGTRWEYLKSVSGGTTSYNDTKAVLGKSYIYTVKPYWKRGNQIQNGSYKAAGVRATTTMGTTSLKSVSPTGLYLKVKWSKVSGAQGYRVYRKVNGAKSWTKIATLKGNSVVSYTDKSVKKNNKYTYTVRAYRKSGGKYYWGGYNKSGKSSQVKIVTKYKKVTDKKSIMYGKTLKLYYDASGKQIQNLESIVGKKSNYYLYINKSKSMITVYYKDGKYYVPYKSMICSAGALSSYTPSGTFHTQAKYRWHELMGPSWGQWCTRIHGGVLFHSVFYNSRNNNNRLSVSAYNKLGSPASHGCVRVTAADAKWIYDNCKLGTTVVIYSKTGYEPLKKPSAYKLPSWHTWDPTDPNMKYKCKQRGCH